MDIWTLLIALVVMGAVAAFGRFWHMPRVIQTHSREEEGATKKERVKKDEQGKVAQNTNAAAPGRDPEQNKETVVKEDDKKENKKDKKNRNALGEEKETPQNKEKIKDKKDKKDKKKDKKQELEEPPEVIAARKRLEQACSGCPYPCDEHAWLPGVLQDKIKWAPLAGNVKTYKKHLLICSGISSALWPPDVEEDSTAFPAQLAAAIKAKKSEIGYTVKLTVCDLRPQGHEGVDIIVFPSMIKILQVSIDHIPEVVQKLLVEKLHPKDAGIPWQPTDFKACVMVCAHKLRDKRCGIAGPLLAKEFHLQCAHRGFADVAVVEVSHTGGHKYAGNVIVYPSGHWYGRVTTCHVTSLLDLHFGGSASEAAFSNFPLSRGPSGCVKDLTDW